MKILFIMDPLKTVHPRKDTTYLLIQESLKRKFETYFCECEALSFRDHKVSALCSEIKKWGAHPKIEAEVAAELGPSQTLALADFGYVFMRTDPPVDFRYLTATYLLAHAAGKTRIVNRPETLSNSNEKLLTLHFSQYCPESLISSSTAQILKFTGEVGGKVVLKPIYRRGGEGILILDLNDPNAASLLELATSNGSESIIAQRFVPEAKRGDKRIIMIDGEPLGAVLRVSQGKDFRNNLHLGGRGEKTQLTVQEKKICEALKPELKKRGLFLVGLDILGDYLTEINFTSPTGFQEINTLDGLTGDRSLEAQTFERLLKMPAS